MKDVLTYINHHAKRINMCKQPSFLVHIVALLICTIFVKCAIKEDEDNHNKYRRQSSLKD
jgi:hypothetical protein